MNLKEAKGLASAPFALTALMQVADKAHKDHAKVTNALNQMTPEELKGHPIHDEHADSADRLANAKQLATAALLKHAGAEIGSKEAEKTTAETNSKLADAQAKETEARAGLVAKAGDHMNANNVHKIIHPPAAEPSPIAAAKGVAKSVKK